MSLLIDISALCECDTNHELEALQKAATEPRDLDDAPHPNPFLTHLVEMFHSRGVTRLDEMWKELLRMFEGRMRYDSRALHVRLTPDELALLRGLLESGNPDTYTPDEWMLLVDYWVERYLPHSYAISEAAWLASRAVLMGRLQAAMRKTPLQREIDLALKYADHAPTLAATRGVLEYGRAHCGEYIQAIADSARHAVKGAILDYTQKQALAGETFSAGRESLQTQLFDRFGTLNRDWRRIAVTEAGEMANQAFVAGHPPGTKLKRVERYDACPFCKKCDGLVLTVVAPDKREKDPWTEVWAGSTNYGKSASPMMRVGEQLVPRPVEQLWTPTAGVFHPHCRGSWVPEGPALHEGDDPEFHDWLKTLWAEKTKEVTQ